MRVQSIWKKRTALGMAGLTLALMAQTAKAQLVIEVYPSQDNANQTIWIFGNTELLSNTRHYSSIRSSGNFHLRDSWKISHNPDHDFYTANKPTNQIFTLSPLFSSASNPKDIESIRSRLPGGSRRTSLFYSGLTFLTSVTNAPTITTRYGVVEQSRTFRLL